MKRIFHSLLIIAITATGAMAQGPKLVSDIQPGTRGSQPGYYGCLNNDLYFFAFEGDNRGCELFSYSGSGAPTMVYDLNPGGKSANMAGSIRTHMGDFQGKLYFGATDGTTGNELYSYDGSGKPPKLVADLEPGAGSSNPNFFVNVGSVMYFAAQTTANGVALYRYDGFSPPVMIPVNQAPTGYWGIYGGLREYNGKLYYCGYSASAGFELFCYDPATNAASLVQDINPGTAASYPMQTEVMGGKLYFIATSATYGDELYAYDGTTVTRLTDLAPGKVRGVNSSFSIAAYNGKLYFCGGTDGLSYQLYRYDPVTANASLVETINPGGNSWTDKFTQCNGKLYFTAYTRAAGMQLWVTDGTTTSMVGMISAGAAGNITDLYVCNGYVYLSASTAATGEELFALKTPAGLQNIAFNGSVELFPNPAKGQAVIALSLKQSQMLGLHLTDISGKTVWTKEAIVYNAGKTGITLPMENLAAGTYFYHLNDAVGKQMASGKVIKE